MSHKDTPPSSDTPISMHDLGNAEEPPDDLTSDVEILIGIDADPSIVFEEVDDPVCHELKET